MSEPIIRSDFLTKDAAQFLFATEGADWHLDEDGHWNLVSRRSLIYLGGIWPLPPNLWTWRPVFGGQHGMAETSDEGKRLVHRDLESYWSKDDGMHLYVDGVLVQDSDMHHYAVRWSTEGAALYCDGKRVVKYWILRGFLIVDAKPGEANANTA